MVIDSQLAKTCGKTVIFFTPLRKLMFMRDAVCKMYKLRSGFIRRHLSRELYKINETAPYKSLHN